MLVHGYDPTYFLIGLLAVALTAILAGIEALYYVLKGVFRSAARTWPLDSPAPNRH